VKKFFSTAGAVSVYTDLPGLHSSNSPLATVSPTLLVISYHPDIVLHNERSNLMALLEPIYSLDSVENLKSARVRKQEKREYQELQSEFERLGAPCFYDTIELQ